MAKTEIFAVLTCFLVLFCSQMKETGAFVATLNNGKRNLASGNAKVEERDPSQNMRRQFGK